MTELQFTVLRNGIVDKEICFRYFHDQKWCVIMARIAGYGFRYASTAPLNNTHRAMKKAVAL